MAHRAEWLMQVEVARLFGTWLPADCYWTATDATTASPTTGRMRQLRGCKAGAPDLWILYCGRLITIELKSKGGRCTPSQRAAREALLRAGADWFECRSANAVMWVLHEEGVPFQMIARSGGVIECWRRPSSRHGKCRDGTRPSCDPERLRWRRSTER